MENDGFNPKEMLATKKQRKLYFWLMKKKNIKSPEAMTMIKKKYKFESFADVDKGTMGLVIDRLINGKKRA